MPRTIQRAIGEKRNLNLLFFVRVASVPIGIIGLRGKETVFPFFENEQVVIILNRKIKRCISVSIGLVFFLEINLISIPVPFGVVGIEGNILYKRSLNAVQDIDITYFLSICSLNKRKIGDGKCSDCFFVHIFASFFFQYKFINTVVACFNFNFGFHLLKIRIGFNVHSACFHQCTVWKKRFVGAAILQVGIIFNGGSVDFIYRKLQCC